MDIKEVMQLVSNFGSTVVVVAYFIYKDIKFNNSFTSLLASLDNSLKNLEKALDKMDVYNRKE